MLIEVAIEPKRSEDTKRLLETLAEVAPGGARFGVKTDSESGQTILLGDSEEELDALIGRAKELGKIEFYVGAPQVAYRETITQRAAIRYTHKKQIGGAGEFAEVTIVFEPLEPASGFVFQNDVTDGSIPKEFVPSVEKGLRFQMEGGLRAGFPLTDFKATLTDGKYHEVDSSPRAFDIAARAAFRELSATGGVKLLEPVMKVEVVTPDEFTGSVIGDFLRRRGTVQGQDTRGNASIITATVPLANMFGFRNALHALSQDRASYKMEFSHYGRAPNPDDDDDPRFPPAMAMRA
jgi:elongation factor G